MGGQHAAVRELLLIAATLPFLASESSGRALVVVALRCWASMAYRLRLAKGVAACAVGHLYLRRNSLTFAQADTASDGTAQAKEPPQASDADISLNMKFRLRNLEPKDFGRNFLDLLSELTTVSKLSQGWCEQRLAMMRSDALQEMVVVEDLDNGLLCAAGTMVIENKFIHKCGRIGHLEDVVVHYGLRAKGLGKRVVDRAVEIAKGHGCYKVLVDCAEKNVAFYEKCGFKRNCVQMSRYFDVEDLPLPEAQPPPAPAGVKAAVELGAFRARPLEPRDKEGFLKLLSQLTTVGDVSEAMFNEQLAKIERRCCRWNEFRPLTQLRHVLRAAPEVASARGLARASARGVALRALPSQARQRAHHRV